MRISTIYSNYVLIADDSGRIVAVEIDGKIAFHLYDKVLVTADCHGYICPGITRSGYGTIVEIRRDDTDYFFGVEMENGEFGYTKDSRLHKIS